MKGEEREKRKVRKYVILEVGVEKQQYEIVKNNVHHKTYQINLVKRENCEVNNNNNNNNDNSNNKKNNSNNKSLDLGNLSDLLTFENNNLPKIVTPRSEKKVNKELIFGFYDSLTNCCFEGYVRSFRVYCSPHRLRKYPKNGIINDELLELEESTEKKEIEIKNNDNDYNEDIYSVKYLNKLQLPCISNSEDNNNSSYSNNINDINKNEISCDDKNRSNYNTIENSTNINTNINKKITTTTKSTSTTNLNNEYNKNINKNNNKNKYKNRIKNHIHRVFLNKKPCINIIPRKPIGPILTKNAIYAVLHDLPANKIILSNNCGHSGQYRGKLVNKW